MLFQKIQKNSKILLTKQIICVIVLPVPSGFPLTILFDIRRSTQVGRRGAPAKGVGRILTGARVQISPSPPEKSTHLSTGQMCAFFNEICPCGQVK